MIKIFLCNGRSSGSTSNLSDNYESLHENVIAPVGDSASELITLLLKNICI